MVYIGIKQVFSCCGSFKNYLINYMGIKLKLLQGPNKI